MDNAPLEYEILLGCVIVNNGVGSKVLHIARHNGISGGTIILGRGTIKSRLLDFLDLNDTRKEIVIMLGEASEIRKGLGVVNAELQLEKPHHGIAFLSCVSGLFGTSGRNSAKIEKSGKVENTVYNAIVTIVNKGLAEDVIDAATKAGSRGGTIIGARGAGIHETSKLFSMEIEPEKEIVLILSEAESTENIVLSIRNGIEIDKPGNGIIFVQPLSQTFGLY